MMWNVGGQVLNQGRDIILEVSMSTKEQRNAKIKRAKELGMPYEVHCVDTPKEIRRERVERRDQEKGASYFFEVTNEMFDYVETIFEEFTPDGLKKMFFVKNTI